MFYLTSVHPALDPESEEHPTSDLHFGIQNGKQFLGDPVPRTDHGVSPLALCCACCSLPVSLAVSHFVQLHCITGPQLVLRGLCGQGQKQGTEAFLSEELVLASRCRFQQPFSACGVCLLVHACGLNPGVSFHGNGMCQQGGSLWSSGSDVDTSGVGRARFLASACIPG